MTNEINITDAHIEVLSGMSLAQYKNASRLKISNGHELFKMSVLTGEISKAKCTIEIATNPKTNKPFKKFHIEWEIAHIYIPAMNLKNAHKKFNKVIAIVDNQIKNMPKSDSPASFLLQGEVNNTESNTENNP